MNILEALVEDLAKIEQDGTLIVVKIRCSKRTLGELDSIFRTDPKAHEIPGASTIFMHPLEAMENNITMLLGDVINAAYVIDCEPAWKFHRWGYDGSMGGVAYTGVA